MELDIVNDVLSENIDLYDRAVSGIRQCLSAYEKRCPELINQISDCSCAADADQKFEELLEIQSKLSNLLFARKFNIGKKLEDLTREFDRLYDPYIREYWFKKFKNGDLWPESTRAC